MALTAVTIPFPLSPPPKNNNNDFCNLNKNTTTFLTFEIVKALQLYKCGLITVPSFYFKNVMLPVLTCFVFCVLFFCINFSYVLCHVFFSSFLWSDVKAFSSAILMWHSGSFLICFLNFFCTFQLAWHLMLPSILSTFFVLLGFWMEMKKSESPSFGWLHYHLAIG